MSLDRVRKLLDTASRPPWWVNNGHMIAVCGNDWDGSEHHVGTPNAMAAESSADAALIAELRNHADALLDLADAARWLPDDGETHAPVSGATSCLYCEEPWPCPTSQIRAALARLDGEDTG